MHVLWILQLLIITNWIETLLMALSLFYLWCMTLWPAAIFIDFLLHCRSKQRHILVKLRAANERNMRGPGVTSHKREIQQTRKNDKKKCQRDQYRPNVCNAKHLFCSAFVTCWQPESAQRLPLLPMIVDAEPIVWDTWDGDSAISSPFLVPKNCGFATFCETNVLSGNIYSWFHGHLN